MNKIIRGIRKFQTEVFPQKRALYAELANRQEPEALVISCADSRVDMQLVTQSEPGQLFFFRNAGNIVPPYGAVLGALSATIEYAMVAVKVKHVIVCGHSDCGGMKGLLQPDLVKDMPTVAQWLRYADVARAMLRDAGQVSTQEALRFLAQENVVAQIDNLKTHPSVALRFARGEVELHGWYYDIEGGQVSAYNYESGMFEPIGEHPPPKGAARRAIVRTPLPGS